MSRLKSLLIWFALPAIAALWLLFGMPAMQVEPPPAETTAQSPRYSLKGVEWTRLDAQGKPEFTATAESADYFDDESARYEQLQVTVVGVSPKPWYLSSPSGQAPPHEKRISMQGPVEIDGNWPDGEAVNMEMAQLWVDPVRRQLQTEEGVVFKSASRSGSAKGLQADWGKQAVQLLGDVRIEYVPKPR
jgi:LPS export ABC transporter protein LptC